jgi:hypothetical protein
MVTSPPKGKLGLGNTLRRPPQSRKKGPRLYRLRPHFAHFLAKKAQKWQKTALAGMAHPPKRGKRAQKKGAFGPFRPKKVAALIIWHEFLSRGRRGVKLRGVARVVCEVGGSAKCVRHVGLGGAGLGSSLGLGYP